MALNFPDPAGQTPTNTFSPTSTPSATTNGVTYTWDGVKWTAQGTLPDYVLVAGDTMTGNLTVPSLNGGQLAGMRNAIINGDFRVWQRGTTFTSSGIGQFTADRWKETGATAGAVAQQSTTAPAGFAYSLQADANTGAIQYGIELDAPNNNSQFPVGSTWTLSVWCDVDITSQASIARFRNSTANPADQVEATAGVPNWSSTGETSNGFTRYKTTFTITGDASTGTNVRVLNINLPNGSVGVRRLAGVQLEPGSQATPFEHRPYGTELALCQRYYQIVNFSSVIFNGNSSSTNVNIMQSAYTDQRTTSPTVLSQAGTNKIYSSAGRREGSSASNTEHTIVNGYIYQGRAFISVARLSATNSFAPRTVGGSGTEVVFTFDDEL